VQKLSDHKPYPTTQNSDIHTRGRSGVTTSNRAGYIYGLDRCRCVSGFFFWVIRVEECTVFILARLLCFRRHAPILFLCSGEGSRVGWWGRLRWRWRWGWEGFESGGWGEGGGGGDGWREGCITGEVKVEVEVEVEVEIIWR